MRKNLKNNRLALGVASALAILISAGVHADSGAKIEFNIAAQSANKSLLELAKQAGSEVMIKKGVNAEMTLPALKGEYTLETALETLLRGTDLTYSLTKDGLVLLEERNPSEGAQEQENVEEVVVTGSRLRGVNATSPVKVITKEDMKRRGINTVEDIVRSLTQNYASVTPVSAIDNSAPLNNLGIRTANLRGLGSNSTLILVNGRRKAVSPEMSDSSIDLNTIPFASIERVEVITDGASAIYGADAVAGVINFIMMKGYDAEERTSVRMEESVNGGDTKTFEQTFGLGWESGTLSGSIRYEDRKPVSNRKIGWVSRDQTSRGGSADPVSAIISNNSAVILTVNGPAALDPNRDPAQPVNDISEFSTSFFEPYNYVREFADAGSESWSAYFDFEQELTDRISVYASVQYTDSKSETIGDAYLLVPAVVPISNAFNNTSQPLAVFYAFNREAANGTLPPRPNTSNSDSLTAVAGFTADLPFADWQLDAYVNKGKSNSRSDAYTNVLGGPLGAALADSNPLTALNLFGDGTQNPDTIDSFIGYAPSGIPQNINTQNTQYNVQANGSLFEMWGGSAKAVIGFDYRKDERKLRALDGLGQDPYQDVSAVFSEINLPLIGSENKLPGIESFDIRIAARYEDYKSAINRNGQGIDSTFTNTSPAIGFSWFVTPELKLRGNVGESFTVPTIGSIFSPPSAPADATWLTSLILPIDPVTGDPTPLDVMYQNVGGLDLTPEISENTSLGFDWTPGGMLQGLSVSATYSHIETEDVILGNLEILFVDPVTFVEQYACRDCDAQFGQPDDPDIDLLYFRSDNFAFQGIRSIDLDVTYDFDTSYGALQAGFTGTYMKTRYNIFFEGLSPVETVNTLDGPNRLRAQGWLSWSNQNYGSTLTVNYSDSYTEISERSGNTRNVRHYITYDLTGYYDMDSGWQIRAGARNLTNTKFPFVDNRTPYDARRVDIRGRTVFLEVSKNYDLF